ncbi:Predicted Zn-dependent peptidase [Daejeonella rubra]|uniref:Predicted Zn-dependent peptidase n=1 Tax=Daejeonella rubra TaxID=990371 RepID=A0A1G9LXK4_9SPHI|nr:pitrilysin family protein [Daejeonella rubra]SDL66802.1 Predicted Zn-dependent peptidase [Daejeonella rubra]
MIDRALAPAFGEVENIELIRAKPLVLANGLKIFSIEGGEQDLVRIEFIFSNIDYDPAKPLQTFATNTMLNDGTSELSSTEIADKIDYYGAFLQTEYANDHSTVTLFTLNKHLANTLPIVKAIVSDSIFPQVELDTLIRNQKQKLSVSLEKNDFLSRKTFSHVLFGDTLYGYDISAADYDNLSRDQLTTYFKSAYQPKNCTVIVSGKVKEDTITLIDKYFGKDWENSFDVKENEFHFEMGSGGEHYLEKADALQSAIRIGQVSINRTHADFPGLQVVNTILGGYFGSRLMANIREDKGFTYGIGSALVSLKNAGYFFIASEVGADVCTAALTEIEKEITILKEQPVTEGELALVRNYMLGSMLGSLENALSHADKFKNIYFSGLDYDYYKNYINTVRNIGPAEVQALANKYLNFNSFEKVIVGKK